MVAGSRVGWLAATLLMVLCGWSLIGSGAASATTPASTTVTSVIDALGGLPSAISCATPTNCVAVDGTGHSVTYDGGSWGKPTLVDAYAATTTGPDQSTSTLTSVSCPTTSFCLAGASDGSVFEDTSGTWSTLTIGRGSGLPTAVSCPTASSCLVEAENAQFYLNGASTAAQSLPTHEGPTDASCGAVDSCYVVAGSDVLAWDGQVWADTTVFPDEAGSGNGAISCANATFCGAISGDQESFLVDGSWTTPVASNAGLVTMGSMACTADDTCTVTTPSGVRVDSPAGQGTATVVDSADSYRQIACSDDWDCAAIGLGGDAVVERNGNWSAPANVDPATGVISGVGCGSDTFCMAVDQSGATMTFDGTTWSKPMPHPDIEFGGVSCAGADFCAAYGHNASGLMLATYSNGEWAQAPTAVAADAISCSSSRFCVAVQYGGPAAEWDGTQWTTMSGGAPQGRTVSCPVDGFCTSGAAELQGSTWTMTPLPFGMTDDINESVSCASATYCLMYAHDRLATFDGSTWTSAGTEYDTSGGPVTCASSTFCLIQGEGYVNGAMDPSLLLKTSDSQTPEGLTIVGQTCPSSHFCIAMDQQAAIMWRQIQPLSSQATGARVNLLATVGVPLSVHLTGSWKAGTTVLRPTYQWYIANGARWTPIPGATGSAFTPTPAMAGKDVVVRVTATAPTGYTAALPVASNYAQVNPANLTSVTPKISGVPRVGKTLQATTGTWKAGSVTLSASHFKYQWYANGKAIAHAASARLKLTRADRGKTMSVKVTGSAAGYRTLSRTSANTSKVRQ